MIMDVRAIPVDAIRVSALNTRKNLDAGTEDGGIDNLAASISEKGLVNPVTVRETLDGRYELIAGQRRLLAFRRLGRTAIPANVRDDLGDADATVLSLIENVQRADMHPLDKAQAYEVIRTERGCAAGRQGNGRQSSDRPAHALAALVAPWAKCIGASTSYCAVPEASGRCPWASARRADRQTIPAASRSRWRWSGGRTC